jgi:hypothetical protein
MAECEVCKKDTVCESVDYGDKCIFHCDKIDEAKWGNPESEDVKRFWRAIRYEMRCENENSYSFIKHIFPIFEDFNKPKADDADGQNFFLANENNQTVLAFEKNVHFHKVVFTRLVIFRNITFKNLSINGCVFDYGVNFSHCIFNDELTISKTNTKNELLFFKCNFLSKIFIRMPTTQALKFSGNVFSKDFIIRDIQETSSVKISHCDFKENFELTTSLGTLAEDPNKIDELIVEKSKLQDVNIFQLKTGGLIFQNNKFKEKSTVNLNLIECSRFAFNDILTNGSSIKLTDLKASQFVGFKNVLLDKTEFNGFDLHFCTEIRLDNVSFIGSHLTNIDWGEINENRFKGTGCKRLDRQMARQLKHINDTQGETVIANDFYALEMRLRSKELKWFHKKDEEKFVQNIHDIVSVHSGNWAIASMWFITFGLLFSVLAKDSLLSPFVYFLFFVIFLVVLIADKISEKFRNICILVIMMLSMLGYYYSFVNLEFVFTLVNPLQLKDSENILKDVNPVLIYTCRIIEVFIGYQIITAIRKNTRRK